MASFESPRGSPASTASPPAAPRRAAGRATSLVSDASAIRSRATSIHGAKDMAVTRPTWTDCPLREPRVGEGERTEERGCRRATVPAQEDVEPDAADYPDGHHVQLPGGHTGQHGKEEGARVHRAGVPACEQRRPAPDVGVPQRQPTVPDQLTGKDPKREVLGEVVATDQRPSHKGERQVDPGGKQRQDRHRQPVDRRRRCAEEAAKRLRAAGGGSLQLDGQQAGSAYGRAAADRRRLCSSIFWLDRSGERSRAAPGGTGGKLVVVLAFVLEGEPQLRAVGDVTAFSYMKVLGDDLGHTQIAQPRGPS